jgi:peptidylprolyl isomerase
MAENESSLIDVSVAKDGGVLKKILKAASSDSRGPPPKGYEVTAHYTGTLASDGSKFDSSLDRGKPFKFTIGQGQVIKGWDQGFATMKVGEKALLVISPEYGYGKVGSPPKIPGNAVLHFEVELLDFQEKLKEKWKMTREERLSVAIKLKDDGTAFFTDNQFHDAAAKYESAGFYSVDEGIDGDKIPKDEVPLYVSCWSNAAMCYIKLCDWTEAIKCCNNVLEISTESSINLKCLYRRGYARLKSGDFKGIQSGQYQ